MIDTIILGRINSNPFYLLFELENSIGFDMDRNLVWMVNMLHKEYQIILKTISSQGKSQYTAATFKSVINTMDLCFICNHISPYDGNQNVLCGPDLYCWKHPTSYFMKYIGQYVMDKSYWMLRRIECIACIVCIQSCK